MIKAKIMLFIITVAATLGIGLAFKTNTRANHFLYTGVINSGVCLTRVEGRVIARGIPNCAASTVPLSSNCPNEYTTFEED
jgi:hypothetical protein